MSTAKEEKAAVGTESPAVNEDIEGLFVRSVSEHGFRRAGFRFTKEGFGIALSALTKQQYLAITSDPALSVEHTVFSEPAAFSVARD